MTGTIRVFQKAPITPNKEAQMQLQKIAALSSTKEVVGLLDMSISNGETPVSTITKSEDTLVPQLSSNVMNCGMGLLKVDLRDEEAQSTNFFARVFDELHKQLQVGPHQISAEDTEKLFIRGAPEAVKQLKLPKEWLQQVDQKGVSNLLKLKTKELQLREIIPWSSKFMGLKSIPGNYLKGNHFVEVQKAHEIVNQTYAKKVGLNKGEYCFAFHFDSPFTLFLNFHYAERKKIRRYPFLKKTGIRLSRNLFHFVQNNPFEHFWLKRKYYCRFNEYTEIPLASKEGQRYLHAVHYGINYGYATRLALGKVLVDSLSKIAGRKIKAKLITDNGHDTFRVEKYDNKEYIVARKGAGKATKNCPAYISGSYDRPSIVNYVTKDNPEWLNSFDHGTGYILKNLNIKTKQKQTKKKVELYKAWSARVAGRSMRKEVVPYKQDERTTTIVNMFKKTHIQPAALLRPIANYKIKKSSLMHDIMRR